MKDELFPADAIPSWPPAEFGDVRVQQTRDWEFAREPDNRPVWVPSELDTEYFNRIRTQGRSVIENA